MRTIPLALSVHHFISSVGADAGFAALIGLAILVLLYFAQARETATLRGRADEAADRVHELEGQLVVLSDQLSAAPAQISVRPAGRRTAAVHSAAADAPARVTAASVTARAMPPAAPAGVGAPALAAATRLIPDPAAPLAPPGLVPAGASGAAAGNGADIGAPGPATVAGAANGAPRQPAVAASAATTQRPVATPPVGAPVGAPPGGAPPAGAAAVGAPPGTGGPRSSAGPVRSPAGPVRSSAGPGRASGGSQTSPPGSGRVPGGSSRPPAGGPGGTSGAAGAGGGVGPRFLPPMDRPAPRRSRAVRVLLMLVGCLVVAAVVAGLLIVTKGGTGAAKKSTASTTSATHRPAPATVFEPSSVTVTVLNGTDINGLAASISQRLSADGYRKGRVTNAANQSTTSSVVQYVVPADRTGALHVASALKLRPSSVGLIDPNTKLLACQSSTPCTAAVVVTVGSDLAPQGSQ